MTAFLCVHLCSGSTNVGEGVCYLVSQLFCLSHFFVEVKEAVDQILSVLQRFLFVVFQNVDYGFV